ncbi:MAG: hypothetical protein ABFC94_05930 [Syntrophomonas sp.]
MPNHLDEGRESRVNTGLSYNSAIPAEHAATLWQRTIPVAPDVGGQFMVTND